MAGQPVKILGRSDILAVTDLKIELVQVPEWDGAVYVRGLTGKERDSFEGGLFEMKGKKQVVHWQNARAALCARAICDEKGKPLFNITDIEQLGAKSASALQRVFAVAQRLSGIADEDIEEMTKNSSETQESDSSTD